MNFEEIKEYRLKQVHLPLGILPKLIFMDPGDGFGCVATDIPDGAVLFSAVFDQQAAIIRYFIEHESFDVIDPKDMHAIPIIKGATMRVAEYHQRNKPGPTPEMKLVTE